MVKWVSSAWYSQSRLSPWVEDRRDEDGAVNINPRLDQWEDPAGRGRANNNKGRFDVAVGQLKGNENMIKGKRDVGYFMVGT